MATNKTFEMSATPAAEDCTSSREGSRENVHESAAATIGTNNTIGGSSGSGLDRLDRYLSTKPILSFGLTLQASWEAIAISFQSTLANGGPSTLVYGCILSTFGSVAMAATLAEMASIKPCVGAQYRWTAMLAPRGTSPKFLGFIQGYLTLFAWNFACALNPYLMGGMIQGCIIICDETYVPQGWHTMLLAWASMAVPIFCNLYARRILASLEIAAAILHVLGLIVFIVVLVVMARRSTADFVFNTSFFGLSGWENEGVQWSIGLLAVIFPFGGFDSLLHMADEVKHAPRRVPQAMVWATGSSGVIGFIFIIVLLFCIGDIDKVSASPTGFPIIETLYEATQSKAGTVVMVMIIYLVIGCSQFNILASVSRLAWAFSRDGGLPYSSTLCKIDPKLRIPVNAVIFTSTICLAINVIPVGSTIAFYALTSLSTLALYTSYVVPCALIVLRKFERRMPVPGPWSMGKYGLAVNLFALAWGVYCVIFLPFPPYLPVNGATMNYAGPIMGAVIVIALGDWVISGRTRFELPKEDMDG